MVPQIIGTKKSKQFRACERYCRERGIEYQHRDPVEKPLSTGEIASVIQRIGSAEELIDTTSGAYKKKGLAWMEYDPVEEITDNPALLRQPIVRTDAGVAIVPDAAELDRLFER